MYIPEHENEYHDPYCCNSCKRSDLVLVDGEICQECFDDIQAHILAYPVDWDALMREREAYYERLYSSGSGNAKKFRFNVH